VFALLKSIPSFTAEEQKSLVDWYTARSRDERLMMHRRGVQIRRARGWPFYVADLQAIKDCRKGMTQ